MNEEPRKPVARASFRLHGLDALRALAILGMVYMHVSPSGWLTALPFAEKPASLAALEQVLSGRAMSLFVLLAGISVALMTGGSRPVQGEQLRDARLRLALRAAVLLLLSLLIDQFAGLNLSILEFYALWLLLLIPLLRMSPRRLLIAAAVAGVALPVFSFVMLNYGREWPISPFSAGDAPAVGLQLLLQPQDWPAKLKQLLVGGGFQTPYAVPLLLAGLAVGRLDLRDERVMRRLAVVGGVLVGLSLIVSRFALGPLGAAEALARMFAADGPLLQPWASLLTLPPHQLYALSIPMAPLMLGVGLLMLAALQQLLLRPRWRSLLAPLSASGRLALTWYAAHLILLERVAGEPPYAFTLFGAMLIVGLVVSPLWLRLFPRGPLEWFMHRASTTSRAATGPPAAGRPG